MCGSANCNKSNFEDKVKPDPDKVPKNHKITSGCPVVTGHIALDSLLSINELSLDIPLVYDPHPCGD